MQKTYLNIFELKCVILHRRVNNGDIYRNFM
jgi:hypothetical protein